jgi:multicomponent Na+:H+ antiporter subunit B
MTSRILQTATRFMMPLLLLFSVFLFLRGHNHPGGGFIGGLVGAAAFALYALAYGVAAAREALRLDARTLLAAGLLIVLSVAVLPLALGLPLLAQRHFWIEPTVPGLGQVALGTPLLFDLGVYLIVVGAALTIILTLAEE